MSNPSVPFHTNRVSEDDSSNSGSKESKTRSVRFANITIREYEVVVGDNPSCEGPPLSLGWQYSQLKTQKIDSFETLRRPHRGVNDLRMSARQRYSHLMNEWQFSMSAVVNAIAITDEIRKQRFQTQSIAEKQKKRRYTKAVIKNLFNRNKKVSSDHHKDDALRIYAINDGNHITDDRDDSSLIPIAARGA